MNWIKASLFLLVFCYSSAFADDINHPLYKLNAALLADDNETAKVVLENDFKNVDNLIEEYGDFSSCKTLDIASEHASVEVMGLLLKKGVNTECSVWSKSGDTPLMMAYMAGKRDIVKFLVENGADVNFENNFGATTFWVSVVDGDVEYISHFLKRGAYLEQSGRFPDPLKEEHKIVMNLTPLMMASARGHYDAIKLLIDAGANLGVQDSLGRDARYYALKSGHEDAVELIDNAIRELGEKDDEN